MYKTSKFYFFIGILLLGILGQKASAEEIWQLSFPGDAKIANGFNLKQEHFEIKVPSSLSGRSVKNFKTTFSADIRNIARYSHQDSDLELRGKANRMDMEYKKDILDVQIFKSKQTQSGSSSCMDCHGADAPRTLATIGYEKTTAKADPYNLNNATIKLANAKSKALRGEINHWMNGNLMLRGKLRLGSFEQGISKLDAKAFSLGLGGYISHKVTWRGDYIVSKVETYERKKNLEGNIDYKLHKNFKLSAGGGVFLDGYTQFGTEFSEMGMLINGVVSDSTKLPSLFNKLKNDRFGYWNLGAEFQYHF
jgi:hypothetical protein